MRPLTILVCGGRTFSDVALVDAMLDRVVAVYGEVGHVVTGDAAGADWLAVGWADRHRITSRRFIANWEAHGRAAGPRRNQRILDETAEIDLCVAFPGGRGTADMVARCKRAGILVRCPGDDL